MSFGSAAITRKSSPRKRWLRDTRRGRSLVPGSSRQDVQPATRRTSRKALRQQRRAARHHRSCVARTHHAHLTYLTTGAATGNHCDGSAPSPPPPKPTSHSVPPPGRAPGASDASASAPTPRGRQRATSPLKVGDSVQMLASPSSSRRLPSRSRAGHRRGVGPNAGQAHATSASVCRWPQGATATTHPADGPLMQVPCTPHSRGMRRDRIWRVTSKRCIALWCMPIRGPPIPSRSTPR